MIVAVELCWMDGFVYQIPKVVFWLGEYFPVFVRLYGRG